MSRRSNRCAQFILLAACVIVNSSTADAANRRWSDAAPGDSFHTSGNWTGGVVPGIGDVAQFGISGFPPFGSHFTYAVSFNVNVTNQALHIEDDLVSFNLNGRLYVVSATSGIVIGTQAGGFAGQLIVNDGTIGSATNIDVGAAPNASGELVVNTGGVISGSPSINIGKDGNGELFVQAGGDISSTGSTTIGVGNGITGYAIVHGTGSTFFTGTLNVGSTGNGTVDVQVNGLLQNSGAAVVGSGSLFSGAGTGTVNVTGFGSIWKSLGLLEVGDGGTGEVNITNGGTVAGTNNVIGANVSGGGKVNVDGAFSFWDNSGDLTVGGLGVGALNITNEGVVESSAGFIGDSNVPSSTGTVAVSGAGSLWINTGDLTVGNAGTGTLNITAGGTVQDADGYVGRDASGTGTVTVDGTGSRWNNTESLTVGESGIGTVNITVGGRVDSIGGRIGDFAGSVGTANVEGTSSRWITSGSVIVGVRGQGTLKITSGGLIESTGGFVGFNPGGSGTATVEGPNSRWTNTGDLTVGNDSNSQGTLNIMGGGQVYNADGTLGAKGAIGTVNVDGTNSLWRNSGELNVGSGIGAQGTLNITSGGTVEQILGTSVIARSENSIGAVTVSGADSQWITASNLSFIVGGVGQGTLNVTAGGKVENHNTAAIMAESTDGRGIVLVDGVGSQWINSGVLRVGQRGEATLDIMAGGQVTNTDGGVGDRPGSTGAVTVAGAGSIWVVGGQLLIGYDLATGNNGGVGTLRIQPGGTVNVTEETVVSAGDLLSLEGGTLSSLEINFQDGGSVDSNFEWTSGTLHVGVFHGDLVNQAGVLAPGNSVGYSYIDGDYNQLADATLQIEIEGGGIDQNDVVGVEKNAFLGGDLELALVNDFVPNSTDTFIILESILNIFNAFANVANGQRLTTSDGLGSFVVNYGAGSPFNPDQIVLSNFLSAAEVPGDYNQNGIVDTADYVLWRNGGPLANEVDTPGIVNAADYTAWRARFGNSGSGAGANVNAVPEPATAVLLIVLAAAGMFGRQCRIMQRVPRSR